MFRGYLELVGRQLVAEHVEDLAYHVHADVALLVHVERVEDLLKH